MMPEKSYNPANVEKKLYQRWIDDGVFSAPDSPDAETYAVLMPPPNVTGSLTFGHVLNHTIQDIYVRRARMEGKATCWFPGLDHAGIATQTKVEQEIKKSEGKTRHDLGREDFLKRVWQWKEQYGGLILDQLRHLGNSSDWQRTLFTLDPSASEAVQNVFISLFDQGLIYRGKRIINWSPLAQSALSDEEVVFKETAGKLYTLRYMREDGNGYLCVATVRPETIFADVAVAVNPNDERYKALIGTNVIVPLAGTSVPVIADEYADMTFGTGCVKITPAHDPNDYEIGLRHNLPMPQCITPDAFLNDLAGPFAGLERFAGRAAVAEELARRDLIEKTEDYTHNVGYSERGGEPIEPYLSDQWFVRMASLAEPALEAVQSGAIRFFPSHWARTYEHWMTGIRDWCISRQLWWGHQIPVYYTDDGRYTAAKDAAEAREKLGLSTDVPLRQDPDVLDTWFSSWLWPMTTMGWTSPGQPSSAVMNAYLPTGLLVTGPDIIFFWVARMIMASLHFTGTVPFRDVYFTSIIRDGKGRKMSKSLGNSPDPIQVIERYGADAVRFTIAYASPLGTDVRLEVNEQTQDIPIMDLGRTFANKIWNAARFLAMKLDEAMATEADDAGTYSRSISDRWIASRLNHSVAEAKHALENYRLTDLTKTLYDFVWRDYCDWYIEIFKVQFNSLASKSQRLELCDFALGVFSDSLRLLHPVMPFITEELFVTLNPAEKTLALGPVPQADQAAIDPVLEQEFGGFQELVEELRRLRAGANIPPSTKLPLTISVASPELLEFVESVRDILALFGRASELHIGMGLAKPAKSLSSVLRGSIEVHIDASSLDVFDRERERLAKEVERLSGLQKSLSAKLSNEGFLAKAPAAFVDAERQKLDKITESLNKVLANLEAL